MLQGRFGTFVLYRRADPAACMGENRYLADKFLCMEILTIGDLAKADTDIIEGDPVNTKGQKSYFMADRRIFHAAPRESPPKLC